MFILMALCRGLSNITTLLVPTQICSFLIWEFVILWNMRRQRIDWSFCFCRFKSSLFQSKRRHHSSPIMLLGSIYQFIQAVTRKPQPILLFACFNSHKKLCKVCLLIKIKQQTSLPSMSSDFEKSSHYSQYLVTIPEHFTHRRVGNVNCRSVRL